MARIVGGVNSVVTLVNFTSFIAQVVTVVTRNTPVQLPSISIPDGASLFIRALVSNGNKKIYVANTSGDTAIPTSRLVLAGGEGIELRIQNANAVWIDASSNNVGVEIFTEQ